ncbi:hypothetical protein [Gudongella sp. DL1XJH-153]|uniref:hypothetical protein n=1 Tax=Gudongella sp. DL1XJH-153 TaxID=3409804 RepID=UPI003BB7F14B
MILEHNKNSNQETEDDYFMKIFNKSNYKEKTMHNDEVLIDNDDSNIKIFNMS